MSADARRLARLRLPTAKELLSPFGVLLIVYAYYILFVYSGVHRYVFWELMNLLTRIIGYQPSGEVVGVYLFGALALVFGFLGGAMLARGVDGRDESRAPLARVRDAYARLCGRLESLPVLRSTGLAMTVFAIGWAFAFFMNAMQVNILGVASLTDIATRWQQSAVLVYFASLQIFFVPALVVFSKKRWHWALAAVAFSLSTVALTLLGARNLPAKLVLAVFLAAVWRVKPQHLWKIVAIALVVFVAAFGIVGALSKSGIYGPAASAGLVVALTYSDSAGTIYNLDRIVHVTPPTGAFGGKLLLDSAKALIPGLPADYSNYQLGKYLGGRSYFVINNQRINRSVSLSTSIAGAPYADWGVPGVALVMTFLGLLFGYLQRRSRAALWLLPFLVMYASYAINGVNAGVYNPHAIVATSVTLTVLAIDLLTGRPAPAPESEGA